MSEPVIFEVTLGPSTSQLMLKMIKEMNYFQFPLIFIIAIHLFSFFCLFKYRNSLLIASIHFVLCCFFISLTNCVNEYLSIHWNRFFFKQNYFDPNCIFIFTFWTIPFSIVSILIIIFLFVDLCKSIAVHRYFDKFTNQINTETNETTEKTKKMKSD